MEPINRRLDALLHEDFDLPEVLSVYADWLEERGAPRAGLIRMSFEAERMPSQQVYVESPGGHLEPVYNPWPARIRDSIAQHWAQWFGPTTPEELELHWEHGFPTQARLRARPRSPASCRALASRPALRFLRRLAVSCAEGAATVEGLELLPSLRHLQWSGAVSGTLAPLGRLVLPRLETLRLESSVSLRAEDLGGLSAATLLSLQQFTFEGPGEDEPRVLAAALRSRWLAELASFCLPVSLPATVRAVVGAAETLEGLGACLELVGPAGLLTSRRALLREVLPLARLRPLPPVDSGGKSWRLPPATSVPVWAPADYRQLPPWTVVKERSCDWEDEAVHAGSGNDCAEGPGTRHFWLCASCASDDTKEIYRSWRSMELRCERTIYCSSEYECRECGKYTHWSFSW